MNTIYVITCRVNKKKYVGQTWLSLTKRFILHKSDAKTNRRPGCIKLMRAIRKHGPDNFSIRKLSEASTQSKADKLEIFYIKKFDVIKNGYNIREGGSCGRLSEKSKKKMSKARKEKYLGEDGCRVKLTEQKVHKIIKLHNEGLSCRKIAKIFNVSCTCISFILNGRTWTHITGIKRIRGKTGRKMLGKNHPASLLTNEDVKNMRDEYQCGDTYLSLGKRYNIGMSTARDIVKRYTWKHIY